MSVYSDFQKEVLTYSPECEIVAPDWWGWRLEGRPRRGGPPGLGRRATRRRRCLRSRKCGHGADTGKNEAKDDVESHCFTERKSVQEENREDKSERDVKEEEEVLAEDGSNTEKIEAWYGLENYCFQVRNDFQERILMDKLEGGEKEDIEMALQEALGWLNTNKRAEKDELEAKQKELEEIVGPIMKRAYSKLHVFDYRDVLYVTQSMMEKCGAGMDADGHIEAFLDTFEDEETVVQWLKKLDLLYFAAERVMGMH